MSQNEPKPCQNKKPDPISLTMFPTDSTNPWANTIKFYTTRPTGSPFTLDWEISFDDGAHWCNIGQTKHIVYVTLGDPVTTLRQETLFEIGCRNANGASTSDQTVDGVWNQFSGRKVQRVGIGPTDPPRDSPDGMIYWKPGANGCVTVAQLLVDGDASCGTWAEFFIDVLKEQGISSASVVTVDAPEPLDAAAGYPNARANYDTQFLAGTAHHAYLTSNPPAVWNVGDIGLEATSNNGGASNGVFFVNTWVFGGAKFMDVSTIPSDGPLPQQGDSPAQGNRRPRAWFGNHAIVLYSKAGVSTYFDPSYGGSPFPDPNRRVKWEDSSLQAYGGLFDVGRWNGVGFDFLGTFLWMERADPKGSFECDYSQ